MTISYLQGQRWEHWSREERMYCAVLYEHARKEPERFAAWVIQQARLDVPSSDEWDLGYEVCFYRDYLWQLNRSARQEGFSEKRTFDLCLFSEQGVVILEAKVCEPFVSAQNEDFRRDREALRRVLDRPDLNVKIVALASSKYFANVAEFGRPDTLSVFDGHLTWSGVAELYADPLLTRADGMYKAGAGACVGANNAHAFRNKIEASLFGVDAGHFVGSECRWDRELDRLVTIIKSIETIF